MILFEGAIGNAYLALYSPKLPVKEELELKTGINIKKIASNKANSRKFNELEYKKYNVSFEFINQSEFLYRIEREVELLNNNKFIEHSFLWDGTGCTLAEIGEENCNYEVSKFSYKNSIVNYTVNSKSNEELSKYSVAFNLSDREGNMEKSLSVYIMHKTDELFLKIKLIDNVNINNIKLNIYADKEKTILYDTLEFSIKANEYIEFAKNKNSYTVKVKNPIIFYSYALEWN